MGLLTKERALIENNYFQVWDVVKLLYEAQLLEEEGNFFERGLSTWHEVGSYLGHHSFDRKLQLFKQDNYYNVTPYEFYPPYQPISNLVQRLKYEWLIGDEKSIRTIEEEVNCYYWSKEDIYNFKPITDLDIIDLDFTESSFFESSLEVSQPDKATKNETDLKEEIEKLKARVAELEQVTLIHPSLDPEHKNHAPELLLAIQSWEAKYLENEYPHQEHTPAITKILESKNVKQVNLVKRICAITNPKK